MIRMRQTQCKPRDTRNFQRCTFAARGKKGFNQQQRRTDYCEVRYQCYGQSRAKQQCYDRSAKVRDSLCSCSKNLPVSTYRQLYQQCLLESKLVEIYLSLTDFILQKIWHFEYFHQFCINKYYRKTSRDWSMKHHDDFLWITAWVQNIIWWYMVVIINHSQFKTIYRGNCIDFKNVS